jgi:predicted ATP-grasp superfamily ATP-dependent carboligase
MKCIQCLNPRALVIGDDVSALNVVRSLGRRGVRVLVLGTSPRGFAAISRYAKFQHCRTLNDEEAVIEGLMDQGRSLQRKAVLFCTSDLHVLFVSRNREILRRYYHFVLPSQTVVDTLIDKKKFYKYCEQKALPIPKTFFSENRVCLEGTLPKLSFPCVVKPLYRTRFWSDRVPPQKKVMMMDSPKQLMQELGELGALNEPLILQEWIHGGDDVVFFCLAYLGQEGRATALLTGRKLRQFPAITGVTSFAETTALEKLSQFTSKLFVGIGCRGLCSLEVKQTAGGGFKIIEPTVGRVDLQEGIGACAKLDLPFIAYQDAIGIVQKTKSGFDIGVGWVNEPFEFNSFLANRRNGTTIMCFLRPYLRTKIRFALLAGDDPKPFLKFCATVASRFSRSIAKKGTKIALETPRSNA